LVQTKKIKSKTYFDLYGWNVLYALKGQKHLAQGNTLGKAMLECRPVRAKASYIRGFFYAFALTGRIYSDISPQGVALG